MSEAPHPQPCGVGGPPCSRRSWPEACPHPHWALFLGFSVSGAMEVRRPGSLVVAHAFLVI